MPRQEDVMPLEQFSPEARARIESLVAEDRPPPRWLYSRGMAAIESRAWYEWHWRRGREPNRRDKISPSLRAMVIARDGLTCGICRLPVERKNVHLDHIKPFSRGGMTAPGNLRVTHAKCNMQKHAKWEGS